MDHPISWGMRDRALQANVRDESPSYTRVTSPLETSQ